jgi:hypothetical protein
MDKNTQYTFLRMGSKAGRKILRHVKDLLSPTGTDRLNSFLCPSPTLLLVPEMYFLTGRPDSTGGCQCALVDEMGVTVSQYHHTMVHIANHPGMNSGPVEAAILRR